MKIQSCTFIKLLYKAEHSCLDYPLSQIPQTFICNFMTTEGHKNIKRFKDENYTIHNFQNIIFIECPKCSKRAIIKKVTPNSYWSERIINCTNCHFSQKGRKESFKVELNCNCSNCSAEINITIPKVNIKKENISVKCKSCEITQNYEPKNIPQEWIYLNNDTKNENYFGLPLWLNTNFKDFNFWAFNYEHLEYLKNYISADLRERNNSTYSTMVEKLPNWMKSSKNRGKLMKIIESLEIK